MSQYLVNWLSRLAKQRDRRVRAVVALESALVSQSKCAANGDDLEPWASPDNRCERAARFDCGR